MISTTVLKISALRVGELEIFVYTYHAKTAMQSQVFMLQSQREERSFGQSLHRTSVMGMERSMVRGNKREYKVHCSARLSYERS